MVGYPGSAEPVDSLAEYGKEMAKQGISFIAMAYPGSYNSYFADKDGLPKYQTFEEVATYYFRPVTEKLRADGAKQIVGFGSALGNRIVRLAETHLGLFDVVVVVSAGDQFGGFAAIGRWSCSVAGRDHRSPWPAARHRPQGFGPDALRQIGRAHV